MDLIRIIGLGFVALCIFVIFWYFIKMIKDFKNEKK